MKAIGLFLVFYMLCGTAMADTNIGQDELRAILKGKIDRLEELTKKKRLLDAVIAQNNEKLTLDEIKRRDNEWINSGDNLPLKLSMSQGRAGISLRKIVSTHQDTYNEAFLTDNQGANVAAYPLTTDYWQGDEEKWQKSFNNGNGEVYVGNIQMDESTHTNAVQISLPMISEGKTVGVLIVGVKLDHIEAAKLK